MADHDSPLWDRLGIYHDLSPHWTSFNIAKALKFGLFIESPEQHTIERNEAFQMVTYRVTYQRQSWIPDTPKGSQAILFPAARADNHPVPTIIEELKLYFNPHIISLIFKWDPQLHTTWDVH